MSHNQIKVKISTRFPGWSFIRQTPTSSGTWKNMNFYIDNETYECDWWIVFGGITKTETVNCYPENTILITDEPSSVKKYHPEFIQQFNTIITTQKEIVAPNIIKKQLLPWYVGACFDKNKKKFGAFNKSYDELKKQNKIKKTKLISVISSKKNKTEGHKKRLIFIKKLKKYFGDKIDVFGFGINEISDKWDAIAPYKYHIVIENSIEEDYWTEKLADAYLGEAYPIYCGCPNIYDYFAIDSLSKINISEPEIAIKAIENIIGNDYYHKSQSNIYMEKEKILDQYQIFPQLFKIINNLEKERKNNNKTLVTLNPEIIKKSNVLDRYIGKLGIFLKKKYPGIYFSIKNEKNINNLKIAIFHNFMDNIGGAEIVTLVLARELCAHIYTTNIDKNKISKMGFGDTLERIHSLGKIPINAPWRHQFAFWKFRRLNLGKKYDFYIIAGDWAMSGAVNNKPNLWYIHSPLNELWHWKEYCRNNLLKKWKRPLFDIWVWFNRQLSLSYAKDISIWVCNSKNTQKRIRKYYNKDAFIIYPPIYTSSYKCKPSKNYWLSVNRLLNHKRIDLQIKAFSKLPNQKLIIVGSYEKRANQFETYVKYIENIRPNNVEIINWVDDKKLKELYSECIGFITTSRDEDFGMTVVEAMASGKPVIAPNEGGYKETVMSGITGLLLDDIEENSLIEAIKKISQNYETYKEDCLKQAQKFDTKIFVKKIQQKIDDCLKI